MKHNLKNKCWQVQTTWVQSHPATRYPTNHRFWKCATAMRCDHLLSLLDALRNWFPKHQSMIGVSINQALDQWDSGKDIQSNERLQNVESTMPPSWQIGLTTNWASGLARKAPAAPMGCAASPVKAAHVCENRTFRKQPVLHSQLQDALAKRIFLHLQTLAQSCYIIVIGSVLIMFAWLQFFCLLLRRRPCKPGRTASSEI